MRRRATRLDRVIDALVAWEHMSSKSSEGVSGFAGHSSSSTSPFSFSRLLPFLASYSLTDIYPSTWSPPASMQKMSPTPNPLFKFARDGFTVHVNNVADAGQYSQLCRHNLGLTIFPISVTAGDLGLVQ